MPFLQDLFDAIAGAMLQRRTAKAALDFSSGDFFDFFALYLLIDFRTRWT